MLKKIRLENFRNHRLFDLELDQVTAIIGKNGVGKSNILESVALISQCRSFREEDKKNLVNYDSDYCRVTADSLEIFIQKEPFYIAKSKENGIPKKQSEFIGLLKTVVFSPESLEIITGSPKNRRRFLDIVLSQLDREYLQALIVYEKVRKERNSLLTAIAEKRSNASELSFWDQELVKNGNIILEKRRQLIEWLNKSLTLVYQEISQKNDTIVLHYNETSEGGFLEKLEQNRAREIGAKRTIIGPHRDDLSFVLSGYEMQNYASRGEIRTAILALKMAELDFLKEKAGGQNIILLLDDVFSEFDETRRKHLGNLITKYQTIITTTDKEHLSDELLKTGKVVELE